MKLEGIKPADVAKNYAEQLGLPLEERNGRTAPRALLYRITAESILFQHEAGRIAAIRGGLQRLKAAANLAGARGEQLVMWWELPPAEMIDAGDFVYFYFVSVEKPDAVA